MKDGQYKIVHKDRIDVGTEIGSFEVVAGKIKNRTGLAAEVLSDGLATPEVEFRVKRLNNGYNWVEWTRPVRHEPQHSLPPPAYEG